MSDDVCIICYQTFDSKVIPGLSHDKVVLPCFESHVCGRPCIVAWFDNGHMLCPICQKKISEEFAAGLDNRTYFQRMVDLATHTGISICNVATHTGISICNGVKTALNQVASPILIAAFMAGMTSGSAHIDPLTLYNIIGALVTGVLGGIALGRFVKIGHLPVIRVIPHGELMARLTQLAAAFLGGFKQSNYSLAFLGLSQTAANGVYGFGVGLQIADQLATRRFGEAV